MQTRPRHHSIRRSFLLPLILAVGIQSSLADDSPPGDSSVGTARIAGTIRWADDRPLLKPEAKLHRWDQKRNLWLPAEKSADADPEGRFAFEALPKDEYWCVVVWERGAGLAFRQLSSEAGQTGRVSATLKPAVTSSIQLRDDQDRPVAGAKFRSWEVVDGSEGKFAIRRGNEAGLGISVSVSDSAGRLELPPLPEGSVLKSAIVEHAEFAAALVPADRTLRDGDIATVNLSRGVLLRFDVSTDGTAVPAELSEVNVCLFPGRRNDNPNLIHDPFSVVQGAVEVRIIPDSLQLLRLESDRFYFTPQFLPSDNLRLRIAEGEHDGWSFRVVPKMKVQGRVVTDKGKPVAKAFLLGEIVNLHADGTAVPKGWGEWAYTEWAETDSEGNYSLNLTLGRGRIRYDSPGVPLVDQLPVTVEADDTPVPDIIVRDLPKIRGTVLGLDGAPAPGMLVRPFSDSSIRHAVAPALTDHEGRFEFQLPWMPSNWTSDERVYEHRIYAYAPHDSIGGAAAFDLREPSAEIDVTIRMTAQPIDWPLSAMREAFTPWERGEPDAEQRRERLRSDNAVGCAVPELDGSLWLNAKQRTIADFRGQYVFLDFYTTWCGPCAADYPTVKMVYDLYRNRGVTVIGVHDNSSSHETIREHAATKGMEMPIVVDHDDGRILKAYRSRWLAMGYPSYLLLDPEGRLITSDRCTPGPMLRGYKLEIVRQILLQRPAQSASDRR